MRRASFLVVWLVAVGSLGAQEAPVAEILNWRVQKLVLEPSP
jgi:hypothetical protein